MPPQTGTKVTVDLLGEPASGEVVRVSETSVWIQLQHPSGTTPTFRFTRRANGDYKHAGHGRYAKPVIFHETGKTDD